MFARTSTLAGKMDSRIEQELTSEPQRGHATPSSSDPRPAIASRRRALVKSTCNSLRTCSVAESRVSDTLEPRNVQTKNQLSSGWIKLIPRVRWIRSSGRASGSVRSACTRIPRRRIELYRYDHDRDLRIRARSPHASVYIVLIESVNCKCMVSARDRTHSFEFAGSCYAK